MRSGLVLTTIAKGIEPVDLTGPAMEADLLDAIDALTGADAWETQIKARKDRLVVEYIPDRDEMIACLAALPDPVE